MRENTISYWDDEFSVEHLNKTLGWNWHRLYGLGYHFVPYDEDAGCVYALACSLD